MLLNFIGLLRDILLYLLFLLGRFWLLSLFSFLLWHEKLVPPLLVGNFLDLHIELDRRFKTDVRFTIGIGLVFLSLVGATAELLSEGSKGIVILENLLAAHDLTTLDVGAFSNEIESGILPLVTTTCRSWSLSVNTCIVELAFLANLSISLRFTKLHDLF